MDKEIKNKEIKTSGGKIDKEVLDVMKQDDILSAISDPKQANRLILNCFCEFLSEIKGLRQDFDEFMQMISVCSSDKLTEFFKELQKNVAQEEVRQNVQKKIKKSHLKPQICKKIAKSDDKVPKNGNKVSKNNQNCVQKDEKDVK